MSPRNGSGILSRAFGFSCGLVLVAAAAGCHQRSAPVVPAGHAEVGVGYGLQSKQQIGEAVQSTGADELRDQKVSRAEELLDGRFPGVYVIRTPSGGFSIRIRGGSSWVGSSEPLYVIDGLPVEVEPGQGLEWLNPADIERIDVLKDATATTMYGLRGANGVIVITTKTGR